MVDPTGAGTYPFGRPVLRRKPTAKSRRRLYVLGSSPGALSIAWWTPHRQLVRALVVDNEPSAFWAGEDQRREIEAWRATVHFQVGTWGEVETTATNGTAGRWVDEHVLAPLGVTREETCFSYCVDAYLHADAGAGFGVSQRYQPFAAEAGLPEARLQPHLRPGALVELALAEHRDRLLKELSVVVPELVVTLGAVPFRVMRDLAGIKQGRKLRADATYGADIALTIGGRTSRWIALGAPCAPSPQADVHAQWEARTRANPIPAGSHVR